MKTMKDEDGDNVMVVDPQSNVPEEQPSLLRKARITKMVHSRHFYPALSTRKKYEISGEKNSKPVSG